MHRHPCACPPPQRCCLSLQPSLYLQRRQRHSVKRRFAGRHVAGWHALEAAQLASILRAGTCSTLLAESIERHSMQLCSKPEGADVHCALCCFQAGPRRPGEDGGCWPTSMQQTSRGAPAAHLPRRDLLQQRIDGGSCAHTHCDFVLRDGRMWRARLGGEAPLHPPRLGRKQRSRACACVVQCTLGTVAATLLAPPRRSHTRRKVSAARAAAARIACCSASSSAPAAAAPLPPASSPPAAGGRIAVRRRLRVRTGVLRKHRARGRAAGALARLQGGGASPSGATRHRDILPPMRTQQIADRDTGSCA